MSAEKYSRRPCLLFRQNHKTVQWTYQAVLEKVDKMADFLATIAAPGDRIGFFAENGPEWPILDLACNKLGLVSVPIHITYNARMVDYIIQDAGVTGLVVSGAQISKIKELIPNLNLSWLFFLTPEDNSAGLADFSKPIYHFSEIVNSHKENKVENKSWIETEDQGQTLATIIYTSGTTGEPKGACLTNDNLISNIFSATQALAIYPQDRFLSILPLSHVLERSGGQFVPLLVGASIAYIENLKKLSQNLHDFHPTIFLGVPRLMEKFYEKVMEKVWSAGKIKKFLFYSALRMASKHHSFKRKKQKMYLISRWVYAVLDFLVFRKVRHSLGGSLRLVISGGAPLDKTIARFFEDVGVIVLEGYGLTETSPIIAMNRLENYRFGTVGLPLAVAYVKINEQKEILVKGLSVFSEYWNKPEETKEAFEGEWFKTGDLGFISNDGYLTVIGRKKDLIVLGSGKKVVPVPLELALERGKYIAQAMVYGNHLPHLQAILVPDFVELQSLVQDRGLSGLSRTELVKHPAIQKFYSEELRHSLKDFSDWEQIEEFKLLDREFSADLEELTPTLKVRRHKVLENLNIKEGN